MTKKTPAQLAKEEIQELVRQIVIKRDGGCIYRGRKDLPPCNGYRGDGELILQADHLITRGKNIGFADTKLIVCACKGHHTAKTFDPNDIYPAIIKELIGEERAKYWDKVKADRRPYHYTLWDWQKTILALKQELTAY